jgi:NAD(P)-dependent dehydrogenase (short-subunit alcohol dehydrogenase family)
MKLNGYGGKAKMIDFSIKDETFLFLGSKNWANDLIKKISSQANVVVIGDDDSCDVKLPLEIDADWSNTIKKLNGMQFDGLINVGMIQTLEGLITTPLDKWKEIVPPNLKLFYKSIDTFKNFLKDGASIVNILEIGEMEGLGGGAVYDAFFKESQFIIRNLAETLAERKIRVNSIRAGYIDTGASLNKSLNSLYIATASNAVPLKTVGTIDDLAASVIFLLSDASKYITGNEIFIDGGAHIASYI